MITIPRAARALYQVTIAEGWTGSGSQYIICQGAGLLRLDGASAGAGVYVPVAAGVPLYVDVTRIYSTADGSTATGYIVVAA